MIKKLFHLLILKYSFQSGTRIEVARAYLVTFVNIIHTIIPTRGFELNVVSVTKSAKHLTWTWGIGCQQST